METIAERLAFVRRCTGLSLRRTAALVSAAGRAVSHDAVRGYERGRTVPARYLRAFCRVFGCRVEWLLTGEGPPLDLAAPGAGSEAWDASFLPSAPPRELMEASAEEYLERVKRAWDGFVEAGRTDAGVRRPVLRSWERSRDAGVPAAGAPGRRPRRVPDAELESRLGRNASLVEAVRPQLEWLSRLHEPSEHVVYLTCGDGIVLASRGSPDELAETWGLLPGYDWSEDAMGTNGAGTALATARPSAVLGPEHYVEGFHGCCCLAAPILAPGGVARGALDLTTTVDHAVPRSLMLVAYAAENARRAAGLG